MTYTVIVTPGERGFVAVCPAIEGCSFEAETVDAVIEGIRGAIEDAIALRQARGEEAPPNHGYDVGERIEDLLRDRAEGGLTLSIAAHEVTISRA